jgi:hypothetical protein
LPSVNSPMQFCQPKIQSDRKFGDTLPFQSAL